LADITIDRQLEREGHSFRGCEGEWFVLSVKRRDGENWVVLGRRRLKSELMQLLERPEE